MSRSENNISNVFEKIRVQKFKESLENTKSSLSKKRKFKNIFFEHFIKDSNNLKIYLFL